VVIIRPELPNDREAVYRVNHAAFAREAEARLVDALRLSPAFIPRLSLVAEDSSEVVGHILFTHVNVSDAGVPRPALALAPMAVLPTRQNRGIGSALVRQGLVDARALGHRVVLVLGHPKYYPRFGFQPAQPLGIHPPFGASEDAFLVLGLQSGALEAFRGQVQYPPEFLQV